MACFGTGAGRESVKVCLGPRGHTIGPWPVAPSGRSECQARWRLRAAQHLAQRLAPELPWSWAR